MATESHRLSSHPSNVTLPSPKNNTLLEQLSKGASQSNNEDKEQTTTSSQGGDTFSQWSLPHPLDSIPSSLQRPVTPSAKSETAQVVPNSVSSTPDSSVLSVSPIYGAKRTASGAVKTSASGQQNGSVTAEALGHSRNISLDSNASIVSELTAQLKTRLSYAMIKVQNGWERHSIDEVEHLTTQLGSPTSTAETTLDFRTAIRSPRAAIANSQRRSRNLSAATRQDLPMAYPPWGQPPKTLEASCVNTTMSSTGQQTSVPTLAPAPEIITSRTRRSIPTATYTPPMLHAAKTTEQKESSTYYTSPHTPSASKHLFREPSEKAEQDAIDTLLFMSSPANSDAYPRMHNLNGNNTANSSPLRTNLPRSNLFGEHIVENSMKHEFRSLGDRDATEKRASKRRSLGIARNKGEVETMLDAMADGDDSSEEDVVLGRQLGIVDVRN